MTNAEVKPKTVVPYGPIAIFFTLVLLFLKLTGVIDISLWWVAAPVLVAAGAGIALTVIAFTAMVVFALLVAVASRKKGK